MWSVPPTAELLGSATSGSWPADERITQLSSLLKNLDADDLNKIAAGETKLSPRTRPAIWTHAWRHLAWRH